MVPKYDEFKTDAAWKQIKKKEEFNVYFKEYSEKSYPNRTYMYNVRIELMYRDSKSLVIITSRLLTQ